MRVAIGADHAGFPLKQALLEGLKDAGHQFIDLGTNSTEPVDYPDYARAVAQAVLRGEAERGIIVCGSGVGACVVANKLPGIRAGLCHDTYSARQGVEHDDMNVLCLGARVIGWPWSWPAPSWPLASPGRSVIVAVWPSSRRLSKNSGAVALNRRRRDSIRG